MQTSHQLFNLYLDARRPIIYIRNFDFQSVDRLIEEICKDNYQIEEYSEAEGRVDFRTKSPKSKQKLDLAEYLSVFNSAQFNKDPKHYLVVLKEVHDSLADKRVYSTLQSIAQRVKMSDEDKNMLPLKRISFLGNNE